MGDDVQDALEHPNGGDGKEIRLKLPARPVAFFCAVVLEDGRVWIQKPPDPIMARGLVETGRVAMEAMLANEAMRALKGGVQLAGPGALKGLPSPGIQR